MSEFLEFSLLGLLSGGVMALIALSFVLIYKGTGVVNFAVGEVMMLGAYIYYAGAVTPPERMPSSEYSRNSLIGGYAATAADFLSPSAPR